MSDVTLDKVLESTQALSEKITASTASFVELKAANDALAQLQAASATANAEELVKIRSEMDAKLAEFAPKFEELQRASAARDAFNERINAAGTVADVVDPQLVKAAVVRDAANFIAAYGSADNGVHKTVEQASAEQIEAYDRHADTFKAAFFGGDKAVFNDVAAKLGRDHVASSLFGMSATNLSVADAQRANRNAAYKMGVSPDDRSVAGMFSPSVSAPQFQMPSEFGTMLKCFDDPTDLLGLLTKRTISGRRYRQWREVPDYGIAQFECENTCAPGSSDGIPLPEPTDGQVYGISGSTCVHMDELEDRDRNWAEYITKSGINNIRRGIIDKVLFGTGVGMPQGLVGGISQYQMPAGVALPDVTPGSFFNWLQIEIAGSSLNEEASKSAALYGNRSAKVHLATTQNAFGDRSNVIRFGSNGTMYVGSYEFKDLSWLPQGGDIFKSNNPLQAQKANLILGDLKQAYHLVVRKEIGVSRHEPVNGGTCVTFLFRARVDGYVACANAAVALISP